MSYDDAIATATQSLRRRTYLGRTATDATSATAHRPPTPQSGKRARYGDSLHTIYTLQRKHTQFTHNRTYNRPHFTEYLCFNFYWIVYEKITYMYEFIYSSQKIFLFKIFIFKLVSFVRSFYCQRLTDSTSLLCCFKYLPKEIGTKKIFFLQISYPSPKDKEIQVRVTHAPKFFCAFYQ